MAARSLSAVCREYLAWLRESRGRKASTVYAYAATLSSLVAYTGDIGVQSIGLAQLERFVQRERRGGRDAAAATLHREVGTLRSLFQYAAARGYVQSDPSLLLHSPTVHNENPRPLEDETWRRVWATEMDADLRMVLGLGYFCGLRRFEMCALRPAQVDVHRRSLVNFTRKGGGDDVLPYGELVDVYRDLLPALGNAASFETTFSAIVRDRRGSDYVLRWGEHKPRQGQAVPGNLTDPQTINRTLVRFLRAHELPHFSPHALRHSFVTNLLRAGMPLHMVARLANHSSPRITMAYTKVAGGDVSAWRNGRLRANEFPERYSE